MKRLLVLTLLLGLTVGRGGSDGAASAKPPPPLPIDAPRVPVGKESSGVATCRVVFVFSTASSSTPAGKPKTSLDILLRPIGEDRQGCIYEVLGHPRVIRTPNELRELVLSRAKASARQGLPPVVLRARGDVGWRHVVRACRAAELAGFRSIHIDPSAARVKLEVVRAGDKSTRRKTPDRVLVSIVSAGSGKPAAHPFLRAQAKSYWLADKAFAPSQIGALSKSLAGRLAEAAKKGRKTLEIEIRADRSLAWDQIEAVLGGLPKRVKPPVRPPGEAPRPGPAPRTNFFGIGGNAHHVVYVVDRSGSMIESFDVVRNEMLISISRLRKQQSFHVVLMARGTPREPKARKLMPATPHAKETAAEFLDTIRPAGQTDPVPALKRAFAVLAKADTKAPSRLIYLLTDGDFPDNAAVLALVRKLNKDKAVRINTYLYGSKPPAAVKVMKQIAAESGGRYKFVSEDE